MSYDPIEDEKKPFTIRDFEQDVKDALVEWANAFDGANDFTKEPHTFDEWMRHFGRFMSGL